MQKRIIYGLISCLIICSFILSGCTSETTPASTSTSKTTTSTTKTTSATSTTTTSTTTKANWWDKFGEPTYGGTYTMRTEFIDIITEPHDPRASQFACWAETLFADDWLVDRDEYPFKSSWTPIEYRQGWMADSYEITDPTTVTVKLRQGIYWHEKSYMSAREFTAEDVQYSYDRILGTGSFTGQDPNGFYTQLIPSVEYVEATDKYTAVFHLKQQNAMAIYEIVEPFLSINIIPHEWLEQSKEERDKWQNVCGTGPFTLEEFEANVSFSCVRNDNYWGYDERYPENKLPYIDEIRAVVIPDIATAVAGLRTGKVDIISDDQTYPSIAQAEALAKTDPQIVQYLQPSNGGALYMRFDIEPFNDVKVRKAMQMAVNIEQIAASYYKGYAEDYYTGLLNPMFGEEWSVPFDKWSADLKSGYTYNPSGAKELLADAGYPNGFTVSLLSATSDDTDLQQVLKGMFSEIGVEMKIDANEKQQRDGMLRTGNYTDEMTAGGWISPGSTGTPGTALGAFWSQKLEKPGGLLGVKDDKYDAYVAAFNAATTTEEAQKLFKEADQYQLAQHWVIQTPIHYTHKVCQPWLKGWSGESFWSQNGWFFRDRLWIDQEAKAAAGF